MCSTYKAMGIQHLALLLAHLESVSARAQCHPLRLFSVELASLVTKRLRALQQRWPAQETNARRADPAMPNKDDTPVGAVLLCAPA